MFKLLIGIPTHNLSKINLRFITSLIEEMTSMTCLDLYVGVYFRESKLLARVSTERKIYFENIENSMIVLNQPYIICKTNIY